MTIMKIFTCLVIALSISISSKASEIAAVDTGTYTSGGTHDYTNTNYTAGAGFYDGYDRRNFFVFNLEGIGSASSATLQVKLPSRGYGSTDVSESFELWDITTDIADLINGLGGVTAYTDLGSGTSYGSVSVFQSDENQFIEIVLNADALASINSSSGLWVIGGSVPSASSGQSLFSYSNGGGLVKLVIGEVRLPRLPAWRFAIPPYKDK
jgi:hypothetical protein